MEYILIGILFMLQLLSFFWIALLNTKLNKFKNLEAKQQLLIEEMDNSIGAYLVEMKDENDRLIEEIKAASMKHKVSQPVQQLEEQVEYSMPKAEYKKASVAPSNVDKSAYTSVQKAVNAYGVNKEVHATSLEQNKVSSILKEVAVKEKPLTFEQKIINMYENGQTLEQIAKATNKGKTEIELLLKFSS